MFKDSKVNYIYTKETNCKGCNKCVFKCPTKANKAYWENSRNIVNIKDGFCISCGECIAVCDHGARLYFDDLDIFLKNLKSGNNISMVIAPSAHVNFDKLNNLIGFLKSLGVKNVYDVSYGADICTWAHLKYIKEYNPLTLIAQPCPVVVSYIEKFHSDLIDYLSPVQSPVACLCIYLKNNLKVNDEIAFLSPCIGKKRECTDENTHDMAKYNITFDKLLTYIEENNINLEDYPPQKFDIVETSIGFAFPRPGGLTENIKMHLGSDVWTKQIEGIFKIEDYFKELISDLNQNNPVPLIIDALNCEHGCNLGTGTRKNAAFNYIDNSINKRKIVHDKAKSKLLMENFDEKLTLSDFLRKYTDRSKDYEAQEIPDLEPIYRSLGKFTAEERNTNCFSCGYGTCKEFVVAVARGDNHINNCHHFLLEKFVSLSQTDPLTEINNRYSYSQFLSEMRENHPKLLATLFIDINKLKETNDLYGHDAGDKLIIDAASFLKKYFSDSIYRVGGDEFVVLESCESKERFEEKITLLKKELQSSKTVFLSLGYAFSECYEELALKISLAEQNMYKDKEAFYKRNERYDRRK